MKNYLVRFLVWLLRKVRGEDPAPTVELGSRIVFDGVEYVCTCAELDTAPILNGTQLQMFFFRWEAMKETLRIAHPMPTDIEITVDYSLADYELAMAEEIKNDWGVPPETANKGHQRNDALDCRRYAQTALEMQGVASVSVLEPPQPVRIIASAGIVFATIAPPASADPSTLANRAATGRTRPWPWASGAPAGNYGNIERRMQGA